MRIASVHKLPFGAVAAGDQRRFADFGHQVPQPDIRYGGRNQYGEMMFGQLTSTLDRADQGDTVAWADLSRRMLRTDSHLASVYESRLAPIAGSRWELDPGNGGDLALAQKAVDDCRWMLESLPNLEQSFYQSLDAVGVGYSVLEIVWTVRGGMVVPECLEWIHPRRFRFDANYKIYLYDDGRAWGYAPEDQKLANTTSGAMGMRLSDDKYIIHQPQSIPDYVPSSGILMTVARQWWVKQWVTKFWLQGAEVAGNPRPVGRYPQEASAEAKAELRAALESLSADGVIAVGPGVEVDFLAPLAQGNSGVWSDLLKTMNAEMSKSVLGSTLNVEIGDTGGNRAAAESQFDTTTLPRAERDGRAMWTTWERQLLRTFLKLNIDRYGGKMPATPKGRFVLYEAPIQIDDLLVDIDGATVNEVRGSRGLEPREGGDRIAKKASAGGFAEQPSQTPTPVMAAPPSTAPAGGRVAGRPFKETPWVSAMRMCSQVASQTSTPSPTMKRPSARRRSR